MKLGIFGDSYADVNGDTELKSWPNLLEPYHIEGRCGISHWYTYKKFLEKINETHFTHLIFCHTNPNRWPCLPIDLEGSNWNIHSISNNSYKDELGFLNKYYLDLFPEDFSAYISKNIFKDVNQYCADNNIYLVNIFCFDSQIPESMTRFPILRNLNAISCSEKIRYENKEYSFIEFCNKFELRDGDPRICHLGVLNNKKISDILYYLLSNKILNVDHDLYKDFEWDIYDINNDELFKQTLENYK